MNKAAEITQASRRAFIRRGIIVVGAVASTPLLAYQKAAPSPIIGSQLYGWGQYYQREGKNLNDHLDVVFSALRDAGYEYSEGFLDLAQPEKNGKIADAFKAKGLKPHCIFTGGALHENSKWETNLEALLMACKVCAQVGYKILNYNPQPIGRDKTDEELATQAKAIQRLGAELRKMGMELGVHNHTPEMANNAREFRSNFDNTDSSEVSFCFDVDWVNRGGMSPFKALENYGNRIVSWHLRQSRDGVWWEDMDSGDIDYERIASVVKKDKLPKVYTIELALEPGTKITRSVVENHRRSIDFVRKVLT